MTHTTPTEHRIDPARLPRDLSRRARAAFLAGALVADEHGEVPGGMVGLRACLGHEDRSGAARAVTELERRRLARRMGAGPATRLFLALGRVRAAACESCGSPSSTGRWCARCKQALRSDRAWHGAAIAAAVHQLATTGVVQPMAISVRVGRPLWRNARDVDSDDGGAVVPLLVEHGLLGPEWMQRARCAQHGDEG